MFTGGRRSFPTAIPPRQPASAARPLQGREACPGGPRPLAGGACRSRRRPTTAARRPRSAGRAEVHGRPMASVGARDNGGRGRQQSPMTASCGLARESCVDGFLLAAGETVRWRPESGRLVSGTLAAPAKIDGVQCFAGRAAFPVKGSAVGARLVPLGRSRKMTFTAPERTRSTRPPPAS